MEPVRKDPRVLFIERLTWIMIGGALFYVGMLYGEAQQDSLQKGKNVQAIQENMEDEADVRARRCYDWRCTLDRMQHNVRPNGSTTP